MHTVPTDDTFAEAFGMKAARVIVTALDRELALDAARAATGNASSVIGCNCEAGIEHELTSEESPDGRPGVSLLFFGFSAEKLEKAVTARVGQNILTCPTTACYNGLSDLSKRIRVGGQLRFFGDGFQNSRRIDERRFWRIPVMDGEFLCEDYFGVTSAIGGGNLLIVGDSQRAALAGVRAGVKAIGEIRDVIMPFPSGIVRSGSKVGSKYAALPASTNHAWCPTLRAQAENCLGDNEHCVYEIVIDGLSERSVALAMKTAMEAACQVPGVCRISAGNYGGKLGAYHFHLHRLDEKLRDSLV
jgi:formylmethanofuran--tetrahydromethanopterin N-formyltransferase